MRALIDRKGEQFGYLLGGVVFTLDDEPTGRIDGEFVLDLVGSPMWRIVGDGLYALDGSETIGFLGGNKSNEYI